MTEDMAHEAGPLYDRAQVRMFTLADYVAEESSGRLYVSGAGLEWTGVPVRLAPDGRGHLLSCYVLLRLAFPRASAGGSHMIEVQALKSDKTAAGQDSLFRVEMRFDLEHVPDDFAEVSGNLPVRVTDFAISAELDSIIFLHLFVDDILISRLPVQLLRDDE